MIPFDADVAVVGAGPAGQALSLALAQSGLAIALVDAAPGPANVPSTPDLRVFALSPASTRLLASIGAWPVPLAQRVCAYRRMHVWERDPADGVVFDAGHVGWTQLGHIVEHGVLQHALAERIAAASRIRSHWHARVTTIESEASGVRLGFGNGGLLRARLVVGADGGGSLVRRLAGIQAHQVDYGQRALVGNVRSAVAHQHVARQRFLPDGPLAFLPLADGACSIVWSLPISMAERLQSMPADGFERELAIASGGILGTLSLESERAGFPLIRQLASAYHAGRVALIGDAAHVVHPLAGQGLNLGFVDVAALADVLESARARGLDIGDAAVLSRYARWRQGENALAAYAFEGIDRFYRVGGGLAQGMRTLGQQALERLPFVKRRFIAHASGLGGRVPSRCGSRVASSDR